MRPPRVLATLLPLAAVSCNAGGLLVVDTETDTTTSTDTGTGTGTDTTTSTGTATMECVPGEEQPCYTGPAGTEGVGACQGGVRTCAADGSGLGACEGETVPQAAQCTGMALDVDCDGTSDDVLCNCLPGATEPCYKGPAGTEGVGTCKAGVRVCDASGQGFGACTGQVTPAPDLCDTPEDEDCDGSLECVVCAPGNGAWGYLYDATAFELNGLERPVDVAVDETGVYYMFLFSSPGVFVETGGGPVPYMNGGAPGSTDAVVVKYDLAGNHLWSHHISGSDSEAYTAADVHGALATDGEHVYLATVTWSGTVLIDDVPVLDIPSPGSTRPILFKLDAQTGDLVWAKGYAMPWLDPEAMAVAGDGRVIIAGTTSGGSVWFHGDPVECAGGGWDVFVAKMDMRDAAGAVDPKDEWVHCFGATGNDWIASPNAVAVDGAGDVYVASNMEQGDVASMTTDAGPFTWTGGGYDALFAKITAGGSIAWMHGVGGPGRQDVGPIAISPAGEPYVAGGFAGTVDFGVPVTASPAGAGCPPGHLPTDGFVARFEPATGKFVAVQSIGSGSDDQVADIGFDPSGRVFVGGWTGSWEGCATTITFDTSPPVSFFAPGEPPVLWAALLDGQLDAPPLWASHFGNTAFSYSWAVAVDHLGYPHLAGSLFGGSLQLGSFTLDATWGNEDTLLASLCRF